LTRRTSQRRRRSSSVDCHWGRPAIDEARWAVQRMWRSLWRSGRRL